MSYGFYDKKWLLNYMKWLSEFSIKNRAFTDDRWVYKNSEISDKDFRNLSELYILYAKLDEYALDNHINLEINDFGNFYKLAINDEIGFYIGYMANQGRMIMCVRKNNINLDECILLDNLLEDEKNLKLELHNNN